MSVVRATFRKQVSDGAYGSETAEAVLERDLEPGEDPAELAAELLAAARRRVHDELRESPSASVRRGVEYHGLTPPPVVETEDELEREGMPF